MECSLTYSQLHATCPYPEPDESSPRPPFFKVHFNIILSCTSGVLKWSTTFTFHHHHHHHHHQLGLDRLISVLSNSFFQVTFVCLVCNSFFPTKTRCVLHPCPSLLSLITQIKSGEQCKSRT
jgi:CO dehydrogenase/acetyl-CoA synthase beta subunit